MGHARNCVLICVKLIISVCTSDMSERNVTGNCICCFVRTQSDSEISIRRNWKLCLISYMETGAVETSFCEQPASIRPTVGRLNTLPVRCYNYRSINNSKHSGRTSLRRLTLFIWRSQHFQLKWIEKCLLFFLAAITGKSLKF